MSDEADRDFLKFVLRAEAEPAELNKFSARDVAQAYRCGKQGYHSTFINAFSRWLKPYDDYKKAEYREYLRLKKKFEKEESND